MSVKDKEIGKHSVDGQHSTDQGEDKSPATQEAKSVDEKVESLAPRLTEKDALLQEMQKALDQDTEALTEDRLALIRERIESGYYAGELQRAEMVRQMMNDLLGDDPF